MVKKIRKTKTGKRVNSRSADRSLKTKERVVHWLVSEDVRNALKFADFVAVCSILDSILIVLRYEMRKAEDDEEIEEEYEEYEEPEEE